MLLKASPASSQLLTYGETSFSSTPLSSSSSSISYSPAPLKSSLFLSLRSSTARNDGIVGFCAASKSANNRPLTGVVFEPFEEVKKELNLVPSLPQVSLALAALLFLDEVEDLGVHGVKAGVPPLVYWLHF